MVVVVLENVLKKVKAVRKKATKKERKNVSGGEGKREREGKCQLRN